MDGTRFDRWTQLLAGGVASRRGVLRGFGVAAVAAALGVRGGGAATCLKNGKDCDPKKPGQCCSGTCRGHRCKPTRGALGCTVRDDDCVGRGRPCPGNPEGFCIVLDNGKPFCALSGICTTCDTAADCDARPNAPAGGICIKHCPECATISGSRACVFPEQIGGMNTAPADGSGRGLVR